MITLKEIRESKFISQRELADKAKLAQVTIIRLEKGRTKPTFKTVRALAKALKVNPGDIQF